MATTPKSVSAHSRRHFLGLAATATGTAAAATLLPPSLIDAVARGRPAGSLRDVEHVVVLMQENRSFDHYFGTLRGVRGFADNSAKPGVFDQGGVRPFLARDAANRGDLSVEYLASLPHSWPDGHQALNEGHCDGWVGAKGTATMAAYDRRDIAFQFALAETFTVCDGYFSSCPTSTSPNRNFLFSGASGFEPSGPRAVGNDAYDSAHPGYTWKTYAESLHEAGVAWRVYQEWDNYTDNNLDFFATFRTLGRAAVEAAGERGGDLTGFYEDLLEASDVDEQRERAQRVHDAAARIGDGFTGLYRRGLHRGEPGSLVSRFHRDVEADELPTVSWIVASAADSEHPSASSPIQSSTLTYRLLDALASNPRVWAKTAMLLTFDEFDGYFDHVVPPLPPEGEPDEWWDGKPMGLGFRVPMTIISPWTVGGRVSSDVFDHTSVVRFLERVTGVDCPNISKWRRRVCGDLVSAFDFGRSDGLRLPAHPGPVPSFEKRWEATPGGGHPVQESQRAVALPTPYRLSAVVVDGVLHLRNDGSRPAVFGVFYDGRVDHHTVRGRRRVQLASITEHVVVTGPDRFLRDLWFPRNGSSADVVLDHASRRIRVNGRDVTATAVTDGWYEVSLAGTAGRQYYTGRLESGRPTATSPLRAD
ncbi:twin-arginine translocation signal domain-containing protein [Gordonia sp. HY002]|uniref:alkaline phosphatase family protein n=1 Tax=Gordonia zhenghanii TaxID=2911516 RepID=UPI001EF0BEEC|nr:alkaline phosphatase family protein [Gordonia zhenghanii]MCF8571877.1 twin-arginine translocation signal domain-containing protein [Gordonia zhenghanii]MCF8604410.1 twin-arginine translocation signal domain-containing protein [Gordonia zhenghanii]